MPHFQEARAMPRSYHCPSARPRIARSLRRLSSALIVFLALVSIPPSAFALATRLQFTATGVGVSDQLGVSVASAGDFNGDGYADVIVGAPFNDTPGADAGRAYVYFGGPRPHTGPDLTLSGA